MSDTNKQPFISVVMPVGDDVETIVRALGGALDQNYPRDRMEVIVIDRGSRDGTWAVAMRATYDTRTRLVDLEGSTLAAAHERGVREARGEIIVVLDGRTALTTDFLAACAAALAQHGDVAVGNIALTGATPRAAAYAAATSYSSGPVPVAYRTAFLEQSGSRVAGVPFGAKTVFLPSDALATRPGPDSLAALWRYHVARGQEKAVALRHDSHVARPQDVFASAVVALVAGSLLGLVVRPLRSPLMRLWRWYVLIVALRSLFVANAQLPQATPPKGSARAITPADLLPYLPFALVVVQSGYGWGLITRLLSPEDR